MNVIEAAEERLARTKHTAVMLAVEEILRNAGTGYLLDMFCALHKEQDRAEFVRCLAGQGRKQMNEQAMDDLSDHLLWMSDLWNDIVEAVAAQIVEAETNSEEVEVPNGNGNGSLAETQAPPAQGRRRPGGFHTRV